jgi:hypothetical protein
MSNSGLVTLDFGSAGLNVLDRWPIDFFPIAPAAIAPVLFGNELANFLRSQLNVNAYPGKLPRGVTTYPLLTYTIVAGQSVMLLSGPCGMAYKVVQFDAWSPNAIQAETLSERLRILLAGSKGVPGFAGPMGRLNVKNVVRGNPRTSFAPPVNGNDPQTSYRYMSEFTFWYDE